MGAYIISLFQIGFYEAVFYGMLHRISPTTFLQLKIQDLNPGPSEYQSNTLPTELSFLDLISSIFRDTNTEAKSPRNILSVDFGSIIFYNSVLWIRCSGFGALDSEVDPARRAWGTIVCVDLFVNKPFQLSLLDKGLSSSN